jgi:glycosyltransferase involved in cell wall biosynthesis
MTTTTVVDCSGVGPGGITRVLSEVVRWWPTGERLRIVGAPRSWEAPTDSSAQVDVLTWQASSRVRSIASASVGLRRATAQPSGRREPTRVLSLSPSAAVVGSRLPVTTIVHDLAFKLWPRDLSRSVRSYRRLSYSIAIRRSASLVCVSARTQHDLFGLYGVTSDRSRIWSPGSDLSPGAGTVPQVLADAGERGARYLLIAGHAPHKGVELALEALFAMPDYVLAVLTGGRRTPELEALVSRSAASNRVLLLDRLSDADYCAAVAGAAAFLMPSHFEGFGLPAAEALGLGTPTIISPDPALHEATQGRAVRMVTWSGEALIRAIRDSERAARPAGGVGRTWRQATADLFEVLHAPDVTAQSPVAAPRH